MNIMMRDGKRFTIVGTFAIIISVFGILFTENTLQAAAFGAMLIILLYVTVKSAKSWSCKRTAEKRWKLKHSFSY